MARREPFIIILETVILERDAGNTFTARHCHNPFRRLRKESVFHRHGMGVVQAIVVAAGKLGATTANPITHNPGHSPPPEPGEVST